MSVSISVWLKDILPHTPGIVRAVARRELINAAREFYRRSTAWREVLENSFFAVGDYDFTAVPMDSNSEIIQVTQLEVNGQIVPMCVERPLGTRPSGTPSMWYPTGPATFEVWPTPDMYDADIRLRAILIPAETAITFPDRASARDYDGLLSGALGRLFGHPAKPYSNPTLAQYHLSRFNNAIGVAAGEVKQGGNAGQNWRFPPFGK